MFPYKPLSDRQIRLITFTNDSGLNCTLEHYPLTDGLKYIALSYTWGKASYRKGRSLDDIYQITLNNQAVEVQQNLHDALRQLGRFVYGRHSKLWVDFICIDQANAAETSQQVRLMTEIYERAGAVYAWLGLPFDDEETRLGVALMQSFHEYLRDCLRANNDDMSAVTATIDTSTTGFPGSDRLEHSKAWDGIAEMLTQPYWGRTWVYQEATAPGEIWFCCGGHCFSDTLLSATVFFGSVFADLPGFPQHLSDAAGSTGNAFRLSSARTAREKRTRSTLLPLLLALRATRCLDARDKVFAPLGLAVDVSGQDTSSPKVDYTRSVAEVYTDVMRYMFERYGLSILSYVYVSPTSEVSTLSTGSASELAIPSWVVDWRQAVVIQPLDPGDELGKGGHCYDVWRTTYEAIGMREIEGAALLVNGTLLDRVVKITSIWDDDKPSYDILKGWRQPLQDLSGDSFEETFNRLLVADIMKCQVDNVVKHVRGGSVDWQLLETPPSALDAACRRQRDLLMFRVQAVCRGRRAGSTARDRLGIFPAATVVGDRVTAIRGSHILHVVRPVTDQPDCYRYVGACYVDGLMDGQAIGSDVRDLNPTLLRLI